MDSEWQTVTLESICSRVTSGGTPRTGVDEYYSGGSIPWVTTTEVNYNRIWDTDKHITDAGLAESSAKLLPPDTVIVAMYGRGTAGRVAYAEVPLSTNQACCNLVVDPAKADPRFVFYALWSSWSRLDALANGSVQQNLSATVIKAFRITLPTLDGQRAIASILGALDDKIELNRKMSRTLDEMAQAIFKSWFVNFDRASDIDELSGLPVGWEWLTLGDLCEKPQYGYTESASDVAVGPRFLRIADINKRPWIEWSEVPYCPISDADHVKYRLHRGDVVIARMADPGHGAYIDSDVDAVFASYLIRFRPLHDEYGRYLQHWLRSAGYWNLVRGHSSGSTRANLNAKVLSAFPIALPERTLLHEFQVVVDALRTRLSLAARESATLGEIRDTLLPRLLSGELRVRDAEAAVEKAI